MFAEAAEAAEAVRTQHRANAALVAGIAARLRADLPAAILTCARGSSDHAATYAKYLIETRLGTLVASASPSVSSLYRAAPADARTCCLAISQSGRSPDLIATVEAARSAGAATLALVNAPDSPLGAAADMLLPLHAGPETSVAATKSYIAALAAIADLVAAWAQDDALGAALDGLPDRLAEAWQADWSPLVEQLAGARGLYVIGRGLGLGIAQEAALKFKETCGLHAEAFSAAEVRHGPMALVGPDFPLLVFRQSDETGAGIDALVAETLARGAPVLVAGDGPAGAIRLPSAVAHPAIEPILQIQSFYRAVNALSLRRGFDPDRPPHLRKVTETV
ncbi:SIS domain-containing protein [Sphingomonas gilva]|uniref:SIS domain-containing protein n=2 Tax=Sphingomonas gilva TaxID=2305907 RepID=A0A396RYA9_9SPHN|nr:SIS domain-containing protein [Sphingomonas gilva]